MRQVFSRLVVAAGLFALACATAVDPQLGADLNEGGSGGAANVAGAINNTSGSGDAGTVSMPFGNGGSGGFAGTCTAGQKHKFECNPAAGTPALPWCQSREPGVGNGWAEAWVDKGQCN